MLRRTKNLFLIPVGLPGMGKSTLAKNFKQAIERHNAKMQKSSQIDSDEKAKTMGDFLKEAKLNSATAKLMTDVVHPVLPSRIEFKKVSYDRILADKVQEFTATHPDVTMHETIDIIRPDADKQYLEDIARHMLNSNNNQQTNSQQDSSSSDNQSLHQESMSIVYCDRNNTSDIWADIRDNFDLNGKLTESMLAHGVKDYKSVVLLPKMEPWDRNLYRAKNPICPHLIFECCKRIFGRKDHSCLSAANKPKAVEVVLKFAKLHDGFDFDDLSQIREYFDDFAVLDFMRYSERETPLEHSTLQTMIEGYNMTPENFGVPSDQIIDRVIQSVDYQMQIDQQMLEQKTLKKQPLQEISMADQNGISHQTISQFKSDQLANQDHSNLKQQNQQKDKFEADENVINRVNLVENGSKSLEEVQEIKKDQENKQVLNTEVNVLDAGSKQSMSDSRPLGSHKTLDADEETLRKLRDPFMAQFVDAAHGPQQSLGKKMSLGSADLCSAASGSTSAHSALSNQSPTDTSKDVLDPSLVVDGQFFNNVKVFNHLQTQKHESYDNMNDQILILGQVKSSLVKQQSQSMQSSQVKTNEKSNNMTQNEQIQIFDKENNQNSSIQYSMAQQQ